MNHNLPAIFAALDDEIRIIRSKMVVDEQVHFRPSLITRGQINHKSFLLVRTGMGRKAMSHAVSYCLTNFKPSVCLNVGYAGGTTPYLGPGDLIVASTVVDAVSGEKFNFEPDLIEKAKDIGKKIDIKIVSEAVVTVDKIVNSPHEKAFLGTEHGVIALDMESAPFAKICKNEKCPCIVVRAILDSLDVVVPDLADAMSDNGKLCVPQIAGHLIAKPKDILSLPKMTYLASKARESIAAFTEAWIMTI